MPRQTADGGGIVKVLPLQVLTWLSAPEEISLLGFYCYWDGCHAHFRADVRPLQNVYRIRCPRCSHLTISMWTSGTQGSRQLDTWPIYRIVRITDGNAELGLDYEPPFETE